MRHIILEKRETRQQFFDTLILVLLKSIDKLQNDDNDFTNSIRCELETKGNIETYNVLLGKNDSLNYSIVFNTSINVEFEICLKTINYTYHYQGNDIYNRLYVLIVELYHLLNAKIVQNYITEMKDFLK
jgi:hypothetical protein